MRLRAFAFIMIGCIFKLHNISIFRDKSKLFPESLRPVLHTSTENVSHTKPPSFFCGQGHRELMQWEEKNAYKTP